MKDWMKDKKIESDRIRLGLHESIDTYTPVFQVRRIEQLANEFDVPERQIMDGLKSWWWERVQNEMNAFAADVAKVGYNSDLAEDFAKRFL